MNPKVKPLLSEKIGEILGKDMLKKVREVLVKKDNQDHGGDL